MTEFNENMCCICLQQYGDDFESIFANNSARTELSTLGHYYEELFQLSIATAVQQPHYLCSHCSLQLKLFHKFKTKAITSYGLFSQFVITAKEGFTICELPDNTTEADSKIGVIAKSIEDIQPSSAEPSLAEISQVKIEQDVIETEDYAVQEFIDFTSVEDSRRAQYENDGVSATIEVKEEAKQLEEEKDYSCTDCDQGYDKKWEMRKHSKKLSSIDFAGILKAIKSNKIDKNPLRAVAKEHNLPKSNLYRYITKLNKANLDVSTARDDELIDFLKLCVSHGVKPLFNAQREKALVGYINKASAIHFGLTIREVQVLAYQYAKKISIKYPAVWNANGQATDNWYYAFTRRHPNLALRTRKQFRAIHSNAFCKENVDCFFKKLKSVLNETMFEPHRIWNVDETGLSIVPTRVVKVIAEKREKRGGTRTSVERGTTVSMTLCVNATGQSIAPFFIFPRTNMKSIFMEHISPGSVGCANQSGWITADEFVKFINHFIEQTNATKSTPTLLLLNSYISHISVEVIDKAIDHGISMISFPPHCSHRMQPLDITVFGPFKTAFRMQCQAWMKNHVGKTLELHQVPLIADSCLDIAVSPENIKSGFRAAGIFPFDPTVFTNIDFNSSQLNGENESIEDDDSDMENRRRRIFVSGADIETAANEEVIISATGMASTPTAAFHAALHDVDLLKRASLPTHKSNRGRKPMKTKILTSPEVVADLHQKTNNKRKKPELQKDDSKASSTIKQKVPAKATVLKKRKVSARKTPSTRKTKFFF